jgi:hypothetical protein
MAKSILLTIPPSTIPAGLTTFGPFSPATGFSQLSIAIEAALLQPSITIALWYKPVGAADFTLFDSITADSALASRSDGVKRVGFMTGFPMRNGVQQTTQQGRPGRTADR